MKILRLISPLLLSLILIGCSEPDGDFCNGSIVIISKTQSIFEKENNQAEYKICFKKSNGKINGYKYMVFVMSDDFGKPGDDVVFENGKMTVKKER